MSARLRVGVVATVVATLAAGCGTQATPGTDRPRSNRLVDFTKKPPFVNALDIDPGSKAFLLTTNRGFFRIASAGGTVARVEGTVSAQGKRSTVGTFLELLATGPGRLIGSGHPDEQGALPSFLGFIRSDDGGRTWRVVSRLGDADLHKIVLRTGACTPLTRYSARCWCPGTAAGRSPRTSRRAG